MKKLILIFCFSLLALFGKAQSWESVGDGVTLIDTASEPNIYALCEYKGKLYVGGNFTFAGNKKAYNIASWDGAKWDTVGSGTNGRVKALCVYKGELYVGGNFNKAGDVRASRIAKWNGKNWASAGNGVNWGYNKTGSENNCVNALCVYHNELYACGSFTFAGTEHASCIAKWDSLHWSTLGKQKTPYYDYPGILGVFSTSFSLGVYNDKLYVGGYLYCAGDLKINFASWDGKRFDSLRGMINRQDTISEIVPLGVFKNKLLVSAGSCTIRGKKHGGVFEWNDTVWSDTICDTYGQVRVACIDNNNLYIAGGFSKKIREKQANNIAYWDGAHWQSLGEGLDRGTSTPNSFATLDVSALAIYKGYLYAGGYFNSSGGKKLNHIARWKLAKN